MIPFRVFACPDWRNKKHGVKLNDKPPAETLSCGKRFPAGPKQAARLYPFSPADVIITLQAKNFDQQPYRYAFRKREAEPRPAGGAVFHRASPDGDALRIYI
jgi:hypothetical protein